MGEAFDVVGDRADGFRHHRRLRHQAVGVKLRTGKDAEAEVEVFEPIGADWEILSSSHRATKLDAHTFKFTVEDSAARRTGDHVPRARTLVLSPRRPAELA